MPGRSKAGHFAWLVITNGVPLDAIDARSVATRRAPDGRLRRRSTRGGPKAQSRPRRRRTQARANRRAKSSSASHVELVPTDDASVFHGRPDEWIPGSTDGPWLYFQGRDGTAGAGANGTDGDARDSRIESLLAFDTSGVDVDGASSMSAAEIHLCKSLSPEGQLAGEFEPDGVRLRSALAKRWTEGEVTWNDAPEGVAALARFAFSRTDENCRWDVFDVTTMLGLSLKSPFATLSVRIGSDYDGMGMYASKEYEEGKFSPRMKVFFGDGGGGAPSGRNDAATSSASAVTSDDGGGARPPPAPAGRLPPNVVKGCAHLGKRVEDFSRGVKYGEGATAAREGKVYECKPYPYSGWCGSYEPEVSPYWQDAWIVRGDCEIIVYSVGLAAGVKSSTTTPMTTPKTTATANTETPSKSAAKPGMAIGDGCAILSFEPASTYRAADRASYQSVVYECKPGPAGQWCNVANYEPGYGGHWDMAWNRLDMTVLPCVEKSSVETSKMDGSRSGAGSPEPAPEEPCEVLFDSSRIYSLHDRVSSENYNYECVAPVWCNHVAYSPVAGNLYSAAAWKRSHGACVGATRVPTTPRPTGEPTPPPTPRPCTNCVGCAPLFTAGYDYSLFERISFENFNYACFVPEKCRQVKYAPRRGADLMGIAWWKDGNPCTGEATRMPTPKPTPLPTTPEPTIHVVTAENLVHDANYTDSVPEVIRFKLNTVRANIEKEVLVHQSANGRKEKSRVYDFAGLLKALGVMTRHPLPRGPFYLGPVGGGGSGAMYGMANIAAFLAQSMVESLKYDACDEQSLDFVNNMFPLANACGQGGASYQDMQCEEDERHYECPVKKDMSIRAITNTMWLAGAVGAPGPLYCAPKTTDQPFSGFWDHRYKCDRPFRGEVCDAYEGQKMGRYDNTVAAASVAARTDVEGCCWWGRGSIPAKGICEIGKMNAFLGKGAAEYGRSAPYEDVDLCEDPEQICSSKQYKELKWVAGMFAWIERVQSYSANGWDYLSELRNFVDGGMNDDSFIDSVSRILNRGCDSEDCGEAASAWERRTNFREILRALELLDKNGKMVRIQHSPTRKHNRSRHKPSGTLDTETDDIKSSPHSSDNGVKLEKSSNGEGPSASDKPTGQPSTKSTPSVNETVVLFLGPNAELVDGRASNTGESPSPIMRKRPTTRIQRNPS